MLLVLNKETKTIDRTKSNGDLLNVIDKAYDVLKFIRFSKQLGTAILKSIYQTLLVSIKITDDYIKSLDLALNANLVPQLEKCSSYNITNYK